MRDIFNYSEGEGPLLITVPHAGREIPADIKEKMTAEGASNIDADWFVDELYKGQGYALLAAKNSRYVLDLNRPRDDQSLYPGQFTTGLFPPVSFAKKPLYKDGLEPGEKEKAQRILKFYDPYHEKIKTLLAQKRDQNGFALLWDGHSIKSRVPSLFDGKLADFNFGTNDGKSCGLPVEGAFSKVIKDEFPEFSFVFNGRFKGGFTTRHYGRPREGVHAVQLELSQATYMNEEKGTFAGDKAEVVKKAIGRLLEVFASLA